MARNSGLKAAVLALEKAGYLFPEECREKIEAIKDEIVDNEAACTFKLLDSSEQNYNECD